MTRFCLPRSLATLAVAVAAVALVGCGAAAPETAPSSVAPSTPAPSGSAPQDAGPTPSQPAPDPACDTIIPADVVQAFTDAGWGSQQDVFRIGATEIPGGLTCTWGDLSVASDHVQMFGWAPIDADTAAQQQAALLQEGWFREDGPDGVYITENKDTVVAPDEDGYGWTYLFGDGWVKFADTKQGLLLVSWPPGA